MAGLNEVGHSGRIVAFRQAQIRRASAVTLLLMIAVWLLSGCGTPSVASSAAAAGTPNHAHDLLVLRGVPQVALLATHTTLYRSSDSGATWVDIGGGDGESMEGLMFATLAQSAQDPQRLYVLAILRPERAKHAAPGIYTSADAGRTWGLATALSAFPAPIFTIAAGASTPGQLFAIISRLGTTGVYMSEDAGQQWHALPAVPTATPSGIVADPMYPQRLLLWSVQDGLFFSYDTGTTWHRAAGTQNGITSVALAGSIIYASGATGMDVSEDGGAHITAVASGTVFDAVVAAGGTPQRAYALSSGEVYATTDGGHTWKPTATGNWQANLIAVDPAAPGTVFACVSSPFGVEMTTNGGTTWDTVLS